MKTSSFKISALATSGLVLAFTFCFSALKSVAAASSTADPTAEIDRLLSGVFRRDAPGAAVLIAQHGAVTLRKGYGLADLELGVPMDPADVFPICSVTKEFTAIAVLQLAEAGKLKLTDELCQYVPDYPTGSAKVTLQQLLTHSSGIPSIEEQPAWRKSWRDDLTPAQILAFTRGKPLDFAPGTNWKYSNTGYCLLGVVIEKVSGQSYADYLRTHVLPAAGMTHSVYPEGDRLVPHRVRGYVRAGKSTWANAPYLSLTQPYSAGSLLATVDDLWSWEQALSTSRVVSASSFQQATTEGHLPDGRSTHYGLGWEISPLGTHTAIGHSGGMPGYSAFEVRVPDLGLYIAILANTNEPAMTLRTLATRIVRIVAGENADAPSASSGFSAAPLGDYVGAYQIAPGANFIIVVQDGALYGQLGRGRRPLKPIGADEFTDGSEEMRFTFERDASRRIKGVQVATDGPGPELIWRRVEPATATPSTH